MAAGRCHHAAGALRISPVTLWRRRKRLQDPSQDEEVSFTSFSAFGGALFAVDVSFGVWEGQSTGRRGVFVTGGAGPGIGWGHGASHGRIKGHKNFEGSNTPPRGRRSVWRECLQDARQPHVHRRWNFSLGEAGRSQAGHPRIASIVARTSAASTSGIPIRQCALH